jgi:16S rRNA (cytidine1402-2'-O)-methyltransferase
VGLAHDLGVRVVPLVGPSSILLALAASGLDGQRFNFLGYLPSDREGRRAALRELDRASRVDGATRIFIETPYRNDHLLEDCLSCLSPSARLCTARAIGSAEEEIRSMPIAEWRKVEARIGKVPAIFLVGYPAPASLDHCRDLGNSKHRIRSNGNR